jgi:predicted DNA binding CopG/RHH family protein
MKTKIRNKNVHIGEIKIVKDFLPPPDKLVFKDEQVKVTMFMSKKSLIFFKLQAKKQHTQYQKMIRALIDGYVKQYGVLVDGL